MNANNEYGEMHERAGGRLGAPAISVMPGGELISLNAVASKAFAGADVKAVLLYWNKETSKIFMVATEKGAPNSYSVSIAKNQHSGNLRAKSFIIDFVGWKAEEREMLPGEWDAKKKVLAIPVPAKFLKAGGTRGVSKSARG